ncbi:sorting nexin-25-like isoform X3 [Oratosquilla oratoria]|uniref:sorting nexin-25-like isoform X3 n=1 Tax=Oratosquilla oratoria TaxID=337810 RepID=UPI003F763407
MLCLQLPSGGQMWAAWLGGILMAVVSADVVWGWGERSTFGGIILPLSMVVGGISAIVLGATLTIAAYVMLSTQHRVSVKIPKEITALHSLVMSSRHDVDRVARLKQGVVVSRKLDAALGEIMDHFIEHNVLPWYVDLVHESTPTMETLRSVLWLCVMNVYDRLTRMDQVQFITCGVVSCLTQHLDKIHVAQVAGQARGERGVFHLIPQLSSPERERNFLRLVAELLISRSLPPEYSKCTPLKTLLKELLACQVFEPLVDRICDPDWINQRLVLYLRQQQAAEELHRRTYMYAASYEDFITLIHDSTDVHDLKHLSYEDLLNFVVNANDESIRHIRRNIINEIMQATAINNLKKAKGVDPSRESTPQGTGKGDLLQARNLKRYINQLTYAKAQCERRIKVLSTQQEATIGHENEERSEDISFSRPLQNLPGQKILMFQVILEYAFARHYFGLYLDEIGHGALLGLWAAIQELRHSDKKLHYQLGMEIYHTYLSPQPPPVSVDKATLRGVEAFLLGNRGPEVLYEIGEEMERILEERHYTGFLVSHTYYAMLTQATLQGVDFMTDYTEEGIGTTENGSSTEVVDTAQQLQLTDHSTYARNKLAHLQERLINKRMALQAIKQCRKADPKVITHLENEISALSADHKQLETHVERTALWSDNIGRWRVYVQNVQVMEDRDTPPHLVLLVHLSTDSIKCCPPTEVNPTVVSNSPSSNRYEMSLTSGIPAHGWVVVRKLPQLSDLHRKLCQISSFMKNIEVPSVPSKMLFGKTSDKTYIDKAKAVAQNYLDTVLTDEKLSGSELVYAFLSPSPEHLKQTGTQQKKSKFSFSTFFKGNEGKGDSDEDDVGVMEGDTDGDSKDSIAEPIFVFLEEVCELRGVRKWLRKTLISFVQITYGKTITKHVRETVSSLLAESMVLYYAHTIRDSLWPSDEMQTSAFQTRTEEDKIRTRFEAREQFINNLPVLLCTLVGQQNARRGAIKLFTTLQHHALNKNLFYTILEVLLKQLFPELQERLDKQPK